MNEPTDTNTQATPVNPEGTWQFIKPTWQFIKSAWVSFWAWFDDYTQTLAAYALLLIATWYHTRAGFAIFEAGQYKWLLAGLIALVIETSTFRITKQLGRHLAINPATKEWNWANFRDRWQTMETLGLVFISVASIYFQTVNAVENGRGFNTLNTGWYYPDLFLWLMGIFLAGGTLSVLHIVFASLLAKAESERMAVPPQPLINPLQATQESLQATIEQQGAAIESLTSGLGAATLDIQMVKDMLIIKCKHCGRPGTQSQINGHAWHCEKNPNKKTKKPAKALNGQSNN